MPDDKLNIMNIITKWLGTAFDVLFIRNPVKTAIGVLMGVVLDTISDIIIQLTNVAISIPMYSWIALSVILMNFRSILPRHAIDEELETQMHYIESVQKKATCAVNMATADEANPPDFKAFPIGRRRKSPCCFPEFAREAGNSFPSCV